tara:strand:+ start:6194 stop:6598 length:405 start_codon:yes stop_codon:yes gene_type:complete
MIQKKNKKIISLGLQIKIILLFFFTFTVNAETVEKKFASLKLLNKTTNKVSQKEVLVNSKIEWETLSIEVLYCASTLPTEIPEDYVLIDLYDNVNEESVNIYRGWMISSEPDVTSIENAIYDLWLLDCTNDKAS